jgi:hypothetical protein
VNASELSTIIRGTDSFSIVDLSSEDVVDFVTDSAMDGLEAMGKGPGNGRGSSHGSKTSALVIGIDA